MSIVSTKMDKTSSTKSVILIGMKSAPREFVEWLRAELDKRNLGIREAATIVGVSHPTISDILTNEKRPSFDTVMALAAAFRKDPVSLLRLAGLLPPQPEATPKTDELDHLANMLGEEDLQDVIEYAKMRLARHRDKLDAQVKPIHKQQSSRSKRPARSALIDK